MEVNKKNYKEWLVRYLEKDMDIAERIETEQFIKDNDWVANEWDLLKRTRLNPNMEIRFPDKRMLFRTEEPAVELKKSVIAFKLYHYAALAAAAALLAFAIVFNIHKPETRTETANTNVHNSTNPNHTKHPHYLTVPSHEVGATMPNKLSNNATVKNHNMIRRSLLAHQKPVQQPLQEKVIKAPDTQPIQNIDYTVNKMPAAKPADSQTIKPAIKEIREPVKQTAVVTKSPVSIPVKVAANSFSNDKSLLQSLFGLLHKISIKKEVANGQTFYAVSMETPDIKINKTIK